MCCATQTLAISPPPRRASVRAAHECRGQGDRRCRCHVAARPHLALARLVTPATLLPVAPFLLQHAPRRPQGPPLSV